MRDISNNSVQVIGKIITKFTFDHEVLGEKFYSANILIERLSGRHDIIPIIVSDRLINVSEDFTGEMLNITGQLRTHNKRYDGKNKLIINIFVLDWSLAVEEVNNTETNKIYIEGYIVNEPVYRVSPLGREITDLMVAVNRPYGKSDYIPCVAWSRNARYASRLEVGNKVEIWGRLQSREYLKRHEDGTEEVKTALELSASRIDLIAEE